MHGFTISQTRRHAISISCNVVSMGQKQRVADERVSKLVVSKPKHKVTKFVRRTCVFSTQGPNVN